jgi:putative methyltransferase (TIGR04325 family)
MKLVSSLKNKAYHFLGRFHKSPKDSSTYENRLLAEVVSKKTEIYVSKSNEKALPNLNYLALLTAFHSLNDIKTINDFGGAAGIHYFLTKSFLPDLKSWTVIETKAMVKEQLHKRTTTQKNKRLFFSTLEDLTGARNECDLLYLSGSLQYVGDPIKILSHLISAMPKLILISRTPFNHTEASVKFTQKSKLSSNGPGPLPAGYKDCIISYEVTIPNYNQVIELLEKSYSIEWVCSENEEMIGPNNSRFKYLSIFARLNLAEVTRREI